MNRSNYILHQLFILTFALTLSLVPFSHAQTSRRSEQSVPSIPDSNRISTALDIGASLLAPLSRSIQSDPYGRFRNARYSNEGLISEQDEIELGHRLHGEISRRYQLTSTGQRRVNLIGGRVARASRRANLTYRFYVVRSDEINAFSIPGGYVYATTGLLNFADDEELASVLSHEVAHIVARHSLKTYQQAQFFGGLADLVGSIAGIAGDSAGQLANTAARIAASPLLAAHNREEEREADFLGVRAMPGANFDPEAMIAMFEKLQRQSQTNRDILGSIFNNHPDTSERISNTRYEVNQMQNRSRR